MTNNTTFPGTLTCPTSSVSNAMTMGTTKTYVVTVSNASGANKFYIDGYLQASLVLHQGQTYIFDLSSGTLDGHPFEFSTTNNGSHAGGSAYSTGITTTGAYNSSQKRTFVVDKNTPTLYYYCTQHSGMGGSVTISPKAELIVSGGAKFIGTGTINLPSGTTSERPTTGVVGMIRYNTTTGYMETYTAAGWGSIAAPPVVTGVSPVSVLGGSTATQVFTVTGTGFDANLSIKLVGADGTEYSVFSTTYVSGLSATFKMGALGATGGYDPAQKPFKVKLTGGSGLSSTLDSPTITIPAPTITGVSPTTLAYTAVGSQTITVTGTNFTSSMASGNKVQVLGVDGSTLYNVDSVSVVSATSITFKLAASGGSLSSGQLANRPYKVRVTGGAGLTATSTQTIGFTGISWTSPAAGALAYSTAGNTSQNLVATDDVGGTNVTFSITAGSVGGLSLGSASASPATYSGTASSAGTTNVTFRVTDNVTGTTADRTFSIVASEPPLYSFSSILLNTGNKTGNVGPNLSELRGNSTYQAQPWTQSNSFFTMNGQRGVQEWKVPDSGQYTFQAFGAAGGNHFYGVQGSNYGLRGAGRIMSRTFGLNKSTVVYIVCGQHGANDTAAYQNGSGQVNEGFDADAYPPACNKSNGGSGGGGGTFAWVGTGGNKQLIVAAGGGGGGSLHNRGSDANGTDGQSGTSGSAGPSGANGQGGTGAGDGRSSYGGDAPGYGWNTLSGGGGQTNMFGRGLGGFGGGGSGNSQTSYGAVTPGNPPGAALSGNEHWQHGGSGAGGYSGGGGSLYGSNYYYGGGGGGSGPANVVSNGGTHQNIGMMRITKV